MEEAISTLEEIGGAQSCLQPLDTPFFSPFFYYQAEILPLYPVLLGELCAVVQGVDGVILDPRTSA